MRLAVLAILLAMPAAGDGVYTYRLRGEIRLLLLWAGRDEVGGGSIRITRTPPADGRWRNEVEVLFGSDPERVPKGINRWGYGRERTEWMQDPGGAAPRLVATEFQGIMRHSPEGSIDEAVAATKQASSSQQFLYDVTVSRVFPERAESEFRVLAATEDFDYRRPEQLLALFREHVTGTKPLRQSRLPNSPAVYDKPFGFLSALSDLIERAQSAPAKPTTVFVNNSQLYRLAVTDVGPLEDTRHRPQWQAAGASQVRRIRFRCLNTVKGTRTDFTLWVPNSGKLKGIPVRIQLQPRWWLRLQMDLASAR